MLLASGILAAVGSAQSGSRTIVFLAKSARGGFFPHHKPHAGDRFGFTDNITGSDGSSGHDYGVCTIVVGKHALCNVIAVLNRGQVELQGMFNFNNRRERLAVTGGTGAYEGARGDATATSLRGNRTRIVVHLVGGSAGPGFTG